MTDWVHSLEESHCAYSAKLADIKDSNQAQPQREELCQINIACMQKSIDDIEQKILLKVKCWKVLNADTEIRIW